MHSVSRLTLAAIMLLSTVTHAASNPLCPSTAKPQSTQQNNQDDQDKTSTKAKIFGLPGSSKRLCWYIGSGIMLIITASAIYWYYLSNSELQTSGHNRQNTIDFQDTSIAPTPGPESPSNGRAQEKLPFTITVTEGVDEAWATFDEDPDATKTALAKVRGLNINQEGIAQVQQAFDAAVDSAEAKALREQRSRTLPANWRQTKSPRP